MGKGKRKVPGLNQSSTADISFILLIFFLVTTSMDTDSGLSRRLPEWDPNAQEQEMKIKERNVMTVQVNKNNEIFVKNGVINRVIDISELTDQLCSIGAAKFYMNTSTNEQRHMAVPITAGETYRVRSIDGYGQMIMATSAYANISTFQNDTPIPTATGWNARIDKQENIFTVPSDGAYLLLTTVNGAGSRCTYEIAKGTIA